MWKHLSTYIDKPNEILRFLRFIDAKRKDFPNILDILDKIVEDYMNGKYSIFYFTDKTVSILGEDNAARFLALFFTSPMIAGKINSKCTDYGLSNETCHWLLNIFYKYRPYFAMKSTKDLIPGSKIVDTVLDTRIAHDSYLVIDFMTVTGEKISLALKPGHIYTILKKLDELLTEDGEESEGKNLREEVMNGKYEKTVEIDQGIINTIFDNIGELPPDPVM